jgi:hypothetical protein
MKTLKEMLDGQNSEAEPNKIERNQNYQTKRFGFSYDMSEQPDGQWSIVDQDGAVIHSNLGEAVAKDVLKRLQENDN